MSLRPSYRAASAGAWILSSLGFLLLSVITIQMAVGRLPLHVAIVPMWIAYASVVGAVAVLLRRSRKRMRRWHAAFRSQLHQHGARTLSAEDAAGWLDRCWTPPAASDDEAPASAPAELLARGPYARWAMMYAGRYNAMLAANPVSEDAHACVMLAARVPSHIMWTEAARRERSLLQAQGYRASLVAGGLYIQTDAERARDLELDPHAAARLCGVAHQAAKMATLLGCAPNDPRT